MAPVSPSPKVLLVSNTGWYLYNFRRPLARALLKAGLEPVFVSPRDRFSDKLLAGGFRWIELKINRRSKNPLRELVTLYHFIAIYAREQPVAVHHFTIKCILYGSIAAFLNGTRTTINAVTGLGHVFIDHSPSTILIRPLVVQLYKWLLNRKGAWVIFQNKDDLGAFLERGMVRADKSSIIRSSGVDLDRFFPTPENAADEAMPIVLFASRLLVEKGIYELMEAARICARNGVKAKFRIAGTADDGNPSSLSGDQLAKWKAEGVADFLGHVEDVETEIGKSSIVVLPSYREGVPRILLEAAAMSKPIVATDVPGCREIVVDRENGLLVPSRDAKALALALETLLRDPLLRQKMGTNGRDRVVRDFGDTAIADKTVAVYRDMKIIP